jgi:hypothetical protein
VADGALVRVKGLQELQRDFKRMSKDLDKDLVKQLKKAAEPVELTAEDYAMSKIRNMVYSPRWAGMRISVTAARDLVYMVPSARGGRRRGEGLGGLLQREMDLALAQNEKQVLDNIDDYLGNLGEEYGF